MLLASVVSCATEAPFPRAVTAVKAAASDAPCIVCLVVYQAATSVPRPARPRTLESASASITAAPPLQSAARARRPDDSGQMCLIGLLIEPLITFTLDSRLARSALPTNSRTGCPAPRDRLPRPC